MKLARIKGDAGLIETEFDFGDGTTETEQS